MFKDGFILNYYSGAKGDFLLRFLANLNPSINENGHTSHTFYFSSIRNKEHELRCFSNNRTAVYNEVMPNFILSLNKVWPYVTHSLHTLTDENFLKIQNEFSNIYDLVVEEEFYNEIFVNDIFKNFPVELTQEEIDNFRKNINPNYNGKFALDREYFLRIDKTLVDFTDEIRIQCLQNYIKLYKNKFYNIMNNYKNTQLERKTNKIYFSKLFYKPYSDLIDLYVSINKKNPDTELFEKLLPLTYVPKELVFFNHKIRIDLNSDNIIEVIGKAD